MKKIHSLLTLGLAVGVLGATATYLRTTEKSFAKKVFAGEVELNKYMLFEDSFSSEAYSQFGVVRDIDARTWSGRFNALDRFFTGEGAVAESKTGSFDSVSWNQSKTNPYVYFTWAGNANNAVEIRKTSDPDAVTPVARITNDQFNGNPMVLNYIQIDTSSLSEGESLFLRLCDNSTEGYGFNSFGYLHVNASATDVSDAIWDHINSLTLDYEQDNEDEANFRMHTTINFYLNGKASSDSILLLSSKKNLSANEDFESNSGFLQRWYRDTSYDGRVGDFEKNRNTIISTADHHWNNNNLPFNKTGNGFFKGYYEGTENDKSGFIASDNAKYRFVSKPFVLSGTGFVSVKMAGRPASLHLLRGTTELAFVDIKSFKMDGEGIDAANITTGFNSCTLVRHVINFNAFLGQVVQIAIADVDEKGDWGAVNFDELITKYDTNPHFKVDEAVQNSIHNFYLDKYVSRANTDIIYVDETTRNANPSDSSVVKEAHDLLDYYYTNFRTPGAEFSFCSVASETKSELVSRYNGLSAQAQAIVDLSEDFDFGDERGVENTHWYDYSMRKQYSVGYIVQYIAARYGISINVKNSRSLFGFTSNIFGNPSSLILILGISLTVVAAALFFALRAKKRKQN